MIRDENNILGELVYLTNIQLWKILNVGILHEIGVTVTLDSQIRTFWSYGPHVRDDVLEVPKLHVYILVRWSLGLTIEFT
jgi:hypothetical protein